MTTIIFEEKIIEITEATVHCRFDGIIHVTFKEGIELDVRVQMKLMGIYNEICKDGKRLFIFSALNNVIITKEARENSIKLEPQFPGIATALIADSLPYRLVANFYLKINKPKTPNKVFKDISSAIEWLKTYL